MKVRFYDEYLTRQPGQGSDGGFMEEVDMDHKPVVGERIYLASNPRCAKRVHEVRTIPGQHIRVVLYHLGYD